MSVSSFLGLSADDAAWVQAIAAIFAVIYAIKTIEQSKVQVGAALDDAKKWKTIEACERYDTDAVLDQALRNLRKAILSGGLKKYPKKYKPDMVTVLNYLDGIAIGVSQGVLVEEIVKDQIRSIFVTHFEEFMDSGLAEKAGIKKTNYMHLCELVEKWRAPITDYRDGKRS